MSLVSISRLDFLGRKLRLSRVFINFQIRDFKKIFLVIPEIYVILKNFTMFAIADILIARK